jgi:hypothetical protein
MLSDEHWLSEVVLREASDNDRIRLLGLSWAPDREIALYPRSVANKVLCERHNHALWRLDATAGATFAVLRRYQQDLSPRAGEWRHRATRHQGPATEFTYLGAWTGMIHLMNHLRFWTAT